VPARGVCIVWDPFYSSSSLVMAAASTSSRIRSVLPAQFIRAFDLTIFSTLNQCTMNGATRVVYSARICPLHGVKVRLFWPHDEFLARGRHIHPFSDKPRREVVEKTNGGVPTHYMQNPKLSTCTFLFSSHSIAIMKTKRHDI
jgi:hypothetical protein